MEILYQSILTKEGLFGLLTTVLILYVIRSSSKREERLIAQNETREDRLITEKKELMQQSEKREDKLNKIILSFGKRFDSIEDKIEEIIQIQTGKAEEDFKNVN